LWRRSGSWGLRFAAATARRRGLEWRWRRLPGGLPQRPDQLTAVGAVIYFTASTSAAGRELWKTDGTAAGTRLVRDLWPGSDGSEPNNLRAVNGRVVFTGFYTGDVIQPRLFTSDGTVAGTVAIQPTSLRPQWWHLDDAAAMAEGAAWFIAGSGSGLNLGLWRTDGTAAGTRAVHAPATWTATAAPVLAVDGFIYLAGGTLSQPRTGGELWKWDIAGRSLQLVANLCPEGWQAPPTHALSTRFGFFFRGYSPEAGFEVWRSLGTPATTALVKDIHAGATDSLSSAARDRMVEGSGGHVFFQATTRAAGPELWRSDGTAAGTLLVRDLVAGTQGSYPTGLVPLGERLVFAASGQLWTSDGTGEGTVLVQPAGPEPTGSEPEDWTRLGERVFFVGKDRDHGTEIWTTDGTDAATRLLKDLYTGSGTVWPRIFGTAGPLLYFEQHGTTENYGLYATDGTTEGTRRLSDARPNSASDAVAAGDTFYFVYAPALEEQTLWRSDGTPNGTTRVKALGGTRFPEAGWQLTAAGENVFFLRRDAEVGDQLWRSDGTESGTVPLVPAAPAWDPIRNVQVVGAVDRHVYFAATTYRHGRELWVSDGTGAGTQLALDLAPGEASSLPRWVGRHGDRVFAIFAADPHSQSPSVRSLVRPDAGPVFLGLSLDAWADDTISLSEERLRLLVEAPAGTALEWRVEGSQTAAGGSWRHENGIFTYTPLAGYLGPDLLNLQIQGNGSPPVAAAIQVAVQVRPPVAVLQPGLRRRPTGAMEFSALVQRGHRYAFERTVDLRDWTLLEKREAEASAVSVWSDPDPPPAAAHYRWRVVP